MAKAIPGVRRAATAIHRLVPAPAISGSSAISGALALAEAQAVPNDESVVPRGTPEPIATPENAIALRAVTTEDVDLLWDWTRQDAAGVKAFLGFAPANSRHLFSGIGKLAELETTGKAWMRSITRDDRMIGIVLIAPIQRPEGQPPVGTVHLYVAQDARGDLSDIVTGMLAAFDASHEPMTLSVIVTRPEWASILTPLGFESTTVLTRPADRQGHTHGS